MDIRSSLDGLKSILGVNPPDTATPQTKSIATTGGSALSSDRATFSSAGSEVSRIQCWTAGSSAVLAPHLRGLAVSGAPSPGRIRLRMG